MKARSILESVNENALRLVIGANFTVNPIHQVLEYWCNKLGTAYEILYLPYQQIIQSLIDPESLYAKNENGINLIFLRLEDCFSNPGLSEKNIKSLQIFIADFEKSLAAYQKASVAPILITECPSSEKSKVNEEMVSVLRHYRDRLAHIVGKYKNAFFISEDDILGLYPMESYDDEFAYKEGKIPYTTTCFTAIGTITCRKISALIRKPYKVIVLDCDNTLWKGICAEDGVQNLIFNSDYRLLQQKMVELRSQGFLICICSKNIEEDVWSVFRYYDSSMPLRPEHITAHRINWLPKSDNLKSLSVELKLSLDSFIFLDDNPAEIAEVRAACPQVACFQIPTTSAQIPIFLRHLWLLDRLSVSEADRQRASFYQQEKNRKAAEVEAFSFDDFIEKLDLQLCFYPLSEEHLDRIAQMTTRTNQFNFTGQRLSELMLRRSYIEGGRSCLIVEAKDRYGEYGVIACVFYAVESTSMVIDNFLISCRALGKRIEFKVWEHLLKLARNDDIGKVEISFVRSERNQASAAFLAGLGMPEGSIGSEISYTCLIKN
jgi:FkbH-like protein